MLFVQATAEILPEELNGLASRISVLFPWGSLLKAAVLPDIAVLRGLRRACQPKAEIRIVFGYDQIREARLLTELALPALTLKHLQERLPPMYREAGFAIAAELVGGCVVREIPSTWAKKLAQGKGRAFFELYGRAI